MKSSKRIVQKLNRLLGKEEKRKLILLFLMTTMGAFLEMLGVSMVVPLVSAIVEPEVLSQNKVAAGICRIFGITSHRGFIICCLFIMIIVFLVKDVFLIFMSHIRSGFVFRNRQILQNRVFHIVIRKPYEYFLNASSGEVLRLIYNDVNHVFNILMMLLSLFSESVVSLALILTILLIDPVMTLLIAFFLSVLLLIILKAVRPTVRKAGIQYRQSSKNVYKWILQTVYGIKEIKVAGRESLFEQRFSDAGKLQTESEQKLTVTSGIPRIILEMGCVCSALLVMAVMVASGMNPRSLVASFAAFAMAAVKLMPSANRILSAANQLSFHTETIDRIAEILEESGEEETEPSRTDVKITLNKEVKLSHITYRYRDRCEEVLTDASMCIPAGHTVGIVGPSGGGKTTVADILLGLLKPKIGQVFSDGTDITKNYPCWLKMVAYIPQSIFMMDGTIRENVVFGEINSNDEKVWRALDDAKLGEFVRKLPNGLDTQIGERGIRLSGGQRQRIGIARALYMDPRLLVFDEATSSLDNETESAIMASINALHGKKTMVIIAHRPQTIENCDIIYKVTERKIERIDTDKE